MSVYWRLGRLGRAVKLVHPFVLLQVPLLLKHKDAAGVAVKGGTSPETATLDNICGI